MVATATVTDRASVVGHLHVMLSACQKVRSDLREGLGDDDLTESVNADMRPWLFGPKSVLPKLAEYVSRADAGAPITGAEFYNFMWIAQQESSIGLVAQMIAPPGLPHPDLIWFTRAW
jgi:hypothetical protein